MDQSNENKKQQQLDALRKNNDGTAMTTNSGMKAVSYTHLTLPTNREV